MPAYLRKGSIPRKRHIAHPQQPGFKGEGIYYEEVIGLAGFSRAYSIAYHLRPPTRVIRLEPAGTIPANFGEQPSLRHHHIKTRTHSPNGRPDHGARAALWQRRRDAGPMPSRTAAARAYFAMPTPTR